MNDKRESTSIIKAARHKVPMSLEPYQSSFLPILLPPLKFLFSWKLPTNSELYRFMFILHGSDMTWNECASAHVWRAFKHRKCEKEHSVFCRDLCENVSRVSLTGRQNNFQLSFKFHSDRIGSQTSTRQFWATTLF